VKAPIPEPVEEEIGDTIVIIPRTQQQQSQEEIFIPVPQEIESGDEHREPGPRPEPQPHPQPQVATRQSRSGRQIRVPERYQAQLAVNDDINTPETYRETLTGRQRSQ
jgi:hypothetical protein